VSEILIMEEKTEVLGSIEKKSPTWGRRVLRGGVPGSRGEGVRVEQVKLKVMFL